VLFGIIRILAADLLKKIATSGENLHQAVAKRKQALRAYSSSRPTHIHEMEACSPTKVS
jgi:hypothetical protein